MLTAANPPASSQCQSRCAIAADFARGGSAPRMPLLRPITCSIITSQSGRETHGCSRSTDNPVRHGPVFAPALNDFPWGHAGPKPMALRAAPPEQRLEVFHVHVGDPPAR